MIRDQITGIKRERERERDSERDSERESVYLENTNTLVQLGTDSVECREDQVVFGEQNHHVSFVCSSLAVADKCSRVALWDWVDILVF